MDKTTKLWLVGNINSTIEVFVAKDAPIRPTMREKTMDPKTMSGLMMVVGKKDTMKI